MTSGRILVTGASGFVGRHLVALLAEAPGVTVIGTGRRAQGTSDRSSLSGYAYEPADLAHAEAAELVVQAARPDWVIHLAAQPSVAESWRDPGGTLVNNLLAELNLLEAVARHAPDSRVLVVGSSEEYGRICPDDLPADEETPLLPNNPYATSKVAQDFLGLQYHLGRGLAVVRTRAFNLFGPGQSDQFAIASFARQIAEAEAGRRPPVIEVGNLDVRRDYTDVRDAARAYWELVRRGRPGEVYNVGGGGVHSIREILEALRSLATRPVEIRVDPARVRPVDTPEIVADVTKIRNELGWEPRISFDRTVRDILDYWRSKR